MTVWARTASVHGLRRFSLAICLPVKVRRRREKRRGPGRPRNLDRAHLLFRSSTQRTAKYRDIQTTNTASPLALNWVRELPGVKDPGADDSRRALHESEASRVYRARGTIIESHQVVNAEATAGPLTFEDLFADEHARLYRALYLIIGNTHEAEELMQDAFLHVLERWDRIDDPAGYLYRSALNSTRSRFRRLAFAAKRPLTPGQPEDPFAAADLRDQMVRALRELPERQRAALRSKPSISSSMGDRLSTWLSTLVLTLTRANTSTS